MDVANMTTEREIQETVARCVSVMVFYHHSKKSSQTTALLADEVRRIAEWTATAKLDASFAHERIFKPFSRELITRYGDDVGAKLTAEFFDTLGHV
jgi:hypothetical protein